MWSLDEGCGDLDRYFRVIESEAKELRDLNPQSGDKPSFNKTRAGSRQDYGSDNYGTSNGYSGANGYSGSSNYGSSSNNYVGGSSSYGNPNGYSGGSNSNYGNPNPPSNNYGSSSNNYGSSSNNYGPSSNNYGSSGGYGGGGGNSNYGSSSNRQDNSNEQYYGNASNNASRPAYTDNGNMNWTSRDTGSTPVSNGYGGPSNSSYGGGGGSNDQSTVYYGNYSQNASLAAPLNNSSNNYENSSAASPNPQHQSSYVANGGDSIKQPTDANNNRDVRNYTAAPVSEDIDGYQRLDFNRCLISYNEPTSLNIRHVFLNVLTRTDLMEYTTKIMECACQDKVVLAIQRDNQLAESFATQLRQKGFWAFEVTNKTAEPVKLTDQHGVYRCAVTTMSFLRDHVDFFKRPSLIINFDHVVSHVKFLERFLNYRACDNPPPADNNDVYIYQMCFNHSTTSQNLKEFIQSQSSPM